MFYNTDSYRNYGVIMVFIVRQFHKKNNGLDYGIISTIIAYIDHYLPIIITVNINI